MSLHKIKEFDPNYRDSFNKQDVLSFDLYSGNEKVGSIEDLLVDDEGKFRYLVINTGFWVVGKKVLLPIGRTQIAFNERRVYADSLSRAQVENLPEYSESDLLDYDYEERVRSVYRPTVPATGVTSTPNPSRDRNSYTYQQDAALYNLDEQSNRELRLYEERLVASKTRQKVGEVAVNKRVETEVATASVPIEKERVVIEETAPVDAGTAVTPGADAFREGEVARVEVYEETPDIHKEAAVREEVSVRKEVNQQTVDAEEQLRRERLDVTTMGHPTVDKRPDPLPDER
ncbi:MAG: DUF2382 domain-containing protein [Leptolyngbyaceae cyanobacterium SL_5_9]|nr:DUF2382 domain-containing protein [Leptolyngbyaceae cyanobacterium SL_5_9]